MTTVSETLDLPGGGSPSSPVVTIELVGEGGYPIREAYDSVNNATIVYKLNPTVTNGAWSSTSLVPNANITPAGTRYKRTVQVGGTSTSCFIEVPTSGTVRVDQILDEAPGTIESSALATHMADVTPIGHVPAGGTDGQVLTWQADDTVDWEDSSGGGGGAPTTADYLVGTANGSLSNEIVVGTSPGGELGGTWASPTVDATHSGSSHAAVQAAAEATAAAALTTHAADTTSIHGIADTSTLVTTAGEIFTGHISVPNDAYDASNWNGNPDVPTKAAIRDKVEDILNGVTFTGDIVVPDEAYDATAWNGSLEVPTKNAVRDKFESLGSGGSVATDAIFDAKGDLPVGTGADTAQKLAVGANDLVLVADSAATTGVKWANAAAKAPFGTTVSRSNDYRGVPGWIPTGLSGNTGAMSPYDIYTFPILVPRPITLIGWDVYVNGGNEAAKVMRLAVYASSGYDDYWQVGALVNDTGTVSVATTGAKAVSGLSVALAAGWHVIAVGTDAAALVLHAPEASLIGAPLDAAQGTGMHIGFMRWWYDYTSSPNYPAAGFPTPLSGNSQHASAFQVSASPGKVPVTLRWSIP